MRRLLALVIVLVAICLFFVFRYHRSVSSPVVHSLQADDGNPACQLPPDAQDVDPQGNPIKWFPKPPEPNETQVPPNRSGGTDCPFYKPAWQRFMLVMQPVNGAPAFLSYPSYDDLFQVGAEKPAALVVAHPLRLSLHPRNIQLPNSPTESQQAILNANRIGITDINQAGPNNSVGGNLIDQHGHLVFYAIHVNVAFRDFLIANRLWKSTELSKPDPNLVFPSDGKSPSVMELKSAWMIVDSPESAPNYLVVNADVPVYSVKDGTLRQDAAADGTPKTRPVWAALIALHIAFTLPGHPEMIWSTFEHTHIDNPSGKPVAVRDNAPAALHYPEKTPDAPIDTSAAAWPLYKSGTTYNQGNQAPKMADMVQHWDEASQSFTKGGLLQTSVFRPYPASKSKGPGPVGPDEDDEVVLINQHATIMFSDALKDGTMDKSDMRQNYRLVGAVWLDQPLTGPQPSFTVGVGFQTAEDTTTDDPTSIVAGEGRLGSTAMESFTQSEGGAPSCFSCHDTKAIRPKGLIVTAAKVNVSHVMGKYLESLPPPAPTPTPPANSQP
jgi:hypothetical protein